MNKILSLVILALFLLPQAAWTCACCSNPGHWSSSSRSIDLTFLKKLKWLPSLFFEEVDEQEPTVLKETYAAKHIWIDGNHLYISIADTEHSKIVGQLKFSFGNTFVLNKKDIRFLDSQKTTKNELYKERILDGKATISGSLVSKFPQQPLPAKLIIQGSGNHCELAPNYQQWMLQFSDSRDSETITFKVVGKLGDGT